MSHDKIRAAARKRMAETGEPYATARREVIKDYQQAGAGPGAAAASAGVRWFALDYSGMGPVSRWTDTRRGGGPGRGGVVLDATALRVLVPGFRLDIPRASLRSAARSARWVPESIGVHGSHGRWLVNGSQNGLVEVAIEPPCYTPRQPSTLFRKTKVRSLTISLLDPDGFIAAINDGEPPEG
jgi:hypothetical protein